MATGPRGGMAAGLAPTLPGHHLNGRRPFVRDLGWPGIPGQADGNHVDVTGEAVLHPLSRAGILDG